jgi:hypothetical protein
MVGNFSGGLEGYMKQSVNKLTMEPIINFSHNYRFMITNLIKITSIGIENFRASLGRRTGGEQGFVWGRYNLLIKYRVYQGEKEILRSKEYSRGFSFALNDNMLPVEEIEEMSEEKLDCQFSFSHGVRPISFCLLPLLSKINYIPFKIDVTVNGSIVNVPLKTDVEEISLLKGALTCEDISNNESMDSEKPLPETQMEKHKEEVSDESFISAVKIEKENNNDTDITSREKKNKAAVPSLSLQYYKKHQLFYDYFFNHQQPQVKKRNK